MLFAIIQQLRVSKVTCDVAETMLKSKKTASLSHTSEWLQYFLNRFNGLFPVKQRIPCQPSANTHKYFTDETGSAKPNRTAPILCLAEY
jgi:hypothetical protein